MRALGEQLSYNAGQDWVQVIGLVGHRRLVLSAMIRPREHDAAGQHLHGDAPERVQVPERGGLVTAPPLVSPRER